MQDFKLSNSAQDGAYSIAKSAKDFAAGCDFVLAAASFVSTAGIGPVAMGTLIGVGALDETKAISKDIAEGFQLQI